MEFFERILLSRPISQFEKCPTRSSRVSRISALSTIAEELSICAEASAVHFNVVNRPVFDSAF